MNVFTDNRYHLKYRFCAWLALINSVVCLANMRTAEIDIKSIMSSLGIAAMSIVFAYVRVQRRLKFHFFLFHLLMGSLWL